MKVNGVDGIPPLLQLFVKRLDSRFRAMDAPNGATARKVVTDSAGIERFLEAQLTLLLQHEQLWQYRHGLEINRESLDPVKRS